MLPAGGVTAICTSTEHDWPVGQAASAASACSPVKPPQPIWARSDVQQAAVISAQKCKCVPAVFGCLLAMTAVSAHQCGIAAQTSCVPLPAGCKLCECAPEVGASVHLVL